jgi:hypothetical protein
MLWNKITIDFTDFFVLKALLRMAQSVVERNILRHS